MESLTVSLKTVSLKTVSLKASLIPWLTVASMAAAASGQPAPTPSGPSGGGAAVDDATFESRCEKAVLALHQFFEEWFNAERPDSAEGVADFRDALADGFQYIGPSGHIRAKSEIFASGTWPMHGWWKEGGAEGGQTRVENFSFRRLSPEIGLATFEYWQDFGEISRGRQDTAIFRLDASREHGVAWLSVQETWLPGTE